MDSMKKKKKQIKRKQKIDVVLESLLNLERAVKDLIKRVESLERSNYPVYSPKDNTQEPIKYWPHIPNNSPPYWHNHNSDIGWDAIDKGLQ
jgi:hypothetical protein